MQITYKSTVHNNKKQQTNKKRDKEVDRINAEYDGMMTHSVEEIRLISV